MKPKPLNAYIWEPRDKHNFGHLGFTATRAACLEILRVAESLASDPRKHEFALPETTIEDLKHIGDRMKMHYRALTIGPAREDGPLVQFKLDQARLHVRLSVPPSALQEFTAMLTEVADDSGDQSFDVEIDGKMADVFYWPCFGHIYKSGEPQNRFPE